MSLDKILGSVSPLIVCGAARSGTRMVTDILNNHPSFVVEEEMHAKTMEAFFRFLNEVDDNFDSYSSRKGRRLDAHWESMKPLFFHFFMKSANKKESLDVSSNVMFHGIKTPGFERYFNEFESVFSRRPPSYVYCVRDAALVWRSWKSLGFLNDFDVFRRRYVRSLRQACKIKKNADGRLVVFDLDQYVATETKNSFINARLVGPLLGYERNLESDIEYDLVENRNSIGRRGQQYCYDKVLKNEMKSLCEDEDIIQYKSILMS
ncbi:MULTISPECIES: sulfotransferase [Halomonadaceae]|uniref:sulfotransferase n=1 Tax=Halomonadaceae TaxID=28256 RepID=UPI0015842017|nr:MULTISPECIES: sulfotransferase [Halomonas]MDI4637448.1 sulfotransferase [Halomonas sp. BMC7]NUJ61282.1 sulfotransferase [Halomonas taeanensis]